MTSLSQLKPFLDPSNPNEIRLPAPEKMALLSSTRAIRLVGDLKVQAGVRFDSSNAQFVLEISKLRHPELQGRVRLLVINGSQQFEKHYDIKEALNNTGKAHLLLFQKELSALEDIFGMDDRSRIRKKFIHCHNEDVAKYTRVYERFKELLGKIPLFAPQSKATDFSSLYDQKHSELAPRQHKISALPLKPLDAYEAKASASHPPGLDSEESTSFTIHGCVIEVNGGDLKSAFKSSMKEQTEKEMQIRVSNPEIANKLVQYLYGIQIVPANDVEARDLYELAQQWGLVPLKELCQTGAMCQHLLDGNPTNLPNEEQFESTLGVSAENMVKAANKAAQQIEYFFERYLKSHITRMTSQL